MPWSGDANAIEMINNRQQITASSRVTPEIFNSLVQLLVYLKED